MRTPSHSHAVLLLQFLLLGEAPAFAPLMGTELATPTVTASPQLQVRAAPTTLTTSVTTSSVGEVETCGAFTINSQSFVPTFTVPFKEKYTTTANLSEKKLCLDNSELMNNMCKGIAKARNCVAQEIRLTYRPDLAGDNRSKVCPTDFCLPDNMECDPSDPAKPCNPYANLTTNPINNYANDPFHLSCDEFPFSNSLEGGDLSTGTATCIPGWQNSFRGKQISQLESSIGAGNEYVVELAGWDCTAGKPVAATNCAAINSAGLRKRDEDIGREVLTDVDFFTNSTAKGASALMMYLGDISPGRYDYQLYIESGLFTDVLAVDSIGNVLVTVKGTFSPGSNSTVEFQTREAAYGVSLWAYTTDSTVSLSYNMTTGPLRQINHAAGTPSLAGSMALVGVLMFTSILNVLSL